MREGYVYIATNDSMPGMVKIGLTVNPPEQRMKQLYSTGVPKPFFLEYYAFVNDCYFAEKAAHKALAHLNINKEFFKCTPAEAVATIECLGITIHSKNVRESLRIEAEKQVHAKKLKEEARVKRELEYAAAQAAASKAEIDRLRSESKLFKSVAWPVGLIAWITFVSMDTKHYTDDKLFIMSALLGMLVGVSAGKLATHLSRTNPEIKSFEPKLWHILVAAGIIKVLLVIGKSSGY